MYDHRAVRFGPIEREVRRPVFDVVGIGFGPPEPADVRPVIDGDRVVWFDVVDSEGEITRGRNLVVASHRAPALPDGIYGSDRVWQASEVPRRLADAALEEPERVVVAGTGEGAAEATGQLRSRFPAAAICSIADVSRVTDVLETAGEVVVALATPGRPAAALIRADAIVFATSRESIDPSRLLGAAAAYCKRDARGALRIGPGNRVVTTEHVRGAIYVAPAGGFLDALRSRFVHPLHHGAQAQPSS